jgi:hypothetical protein
MTNVYLIVRICGISGVLIMFGQGQGPKIGAIIIIQADRCWLVVVSVATDRAFYSVRWNL